MRLFAPILLILCFFPSAICNYSPSSSLKPTSGLSLTKFKKVEGENKKRPDKSPEASVVVALTEPSSEDARKGYLCILGGALTHLMLGTLYCWGNFLSYAPESLRFWDGKPHVGQSPDALFVLPLTIVFQALAMPFGPMIVKKFGAKYAMLFGASLTFLGVFLASFQTNLLMFMLFYSVMFGAGCGIAYTPPMIAGWSFLPNAKGLVSGAILAGFGGGGFIFNNIGSKIVNPNGANLVNGKFPSEVYALFPSMLRKLSAIYAVLALMGFAFLSEPKKVQEAAVPTSRVSTEVYQSVPGLNLKQALGTWQFWLVWTMIIASATAGLNTATIYKQFAGGFDELKGDSYQALVGGLGALFNGSGRLAWGTLSDKIGFKHAFMLLTGLQITGLMTYSKSVVSKGLFLANTCLLFFCLAGNLALFPPATQRIFGSYQGPLIYAVMYSAFGIASVAGGFLTKKLVSTLGWLVVFQVLAAMTFVATCLVTQLRPLASFSGSIV